MKKVFLASLLVMFTCLGASAQSGYMVVNSEKIFKAMPSYTQAQTTIETLSTEYQKSIDTAFAAIEKSYNSYMEQKAYLSETSRKSREEAIITMEKNVTKRQQEYFGPEGEVAKRRTELLKPIQERVQQAIKEYAQANNYTLVLDESAGESVLFASPALNKSDEIIKLVK